MFSEEADLGVSLEVETGQDRIAWHIEGGWQMREVLAGVRSGQKKRRDSQLAGPGGPWGRRVFWAVCSGCVMENLLIKLSVKSTLLTNAFGDSGCSLGTVQMCRVLYRRGQG